MHAKTRFRIRLGVATVVATIASLLVPTVAFAAGGTLETPDSEPRGRRYAADRAIVGIERGDRAEAMNVIEDGGGDILGYNRPGEFFVVETASDSAEWAQVVADDASVRYAEPDWKITADDIAPADPSWSTLWGHRQIAAPSAWRTTTGSDDVVVGVIDSGVDYHHEDLAAQMWVNPDEDAATPGDDDNNGWANDIHGIDCANDDSDPTDDIGHGTHVAGTIGAAANNNNGIAGVAWNVKIMALKFLGADGTGYTSDAIECLYYAINNGAHVTNNSWGGPSFSKTLQDAIRFAGSKNQLFIAAAGNDGADTSIAPRYPSSYELDNVISVTATGRDDSLASFSNYGSSSVDIAAPGIDIMSTVPGGYASYSGTSMATPHVAGAAALLLAADPSLRADAPKLRDALLDNVDPVPALQGKVLIGGRLNVARSVSPDAPRSIHVHDIATSTQSASKRYATTAVTVVIATDREKPIAGALVSLTWSSGKAATCVTTSDGTCTASKRVKKSAITSLTVTVASVSHDFLAYEALADHDLVDVKQVAISI